MIYGLNQIDWILQNLAAIRKDLGMTLSDWGKEFNLCTTHAKAWEVGVLTPRVRKIQQICKFLSDHKYQVPVESDGTSLDQALDVLKNFYVWTDGLNLNELSKELGISRSTITNIAKGRIVEFPILMRIWQLKQNQTQPKKEAKKFDGRWTIAVMLDQLRRMGDLRKELNIKRSEMAERLGCEADDIRMIETTPQLCPFKIAIKFSEWTKTIHKKPLRSRSGNLELKDLLTEDGLRNARKSLGLKSHDSIELWLLEDKESLKIAS